MKHTKGPWNLIKAEPNIHGLSYTQLETSDGKQPVVYVTIDGALSIQEADARLIAAAPELLEALKQARDAVYAYEPNSTDLIDIERAINKAEGKGE